MPISRRGLWLVLLLLVLVALTERWVVPRWLASRGPMGAASWISATPLEPPPAEEADAGAAGAAGELGFFAVKDFEVDTLAGADDDTGAGPSAPRAVLRVVGDEDFWVNLNGVAVAAGHWRGDPRMVVCEVGPYLRTGSNRLSVEVRAARPSGGLLLSLEIGDSGEQRIVTDSSWSIVRRHQPALSEPGAELEGLERARVWGPPPTGRWGWPREEGRQPALAELLLPGGAVPAERARVGDPAGPWFRLPPRPDQAAPLAHWVTFDFGAVRTGHLSVFFSDQGPVRGLVFSGVSPPDPRVESPDAVLLKVPGLRAWTQVAPRRFRYVTVISPTKVLGARVYPVAPQRARLLLAETAPSPGAFGLELGLRTPVENEIWREFERLAHRAGAEGG